MPRKKGSSVPSLRRHAPSGQGRVILNGQHHYLGAWPDNQDKPPADVKAAYDRTIAEWLAGGRLPLKRNLDRRSRAHRETVSQPLTSSHEPAVPDSVTIAELALAFQRHADSYYRHKDRTPTNEARNIRYALRPLVHAYATLAANRFEPSHLKAVRNLLITGYDHPEYGKQPACCRTSINQRIGKIIRAFRWAAEEGLIPETVWLKLRSIKPLQQGRSTAIETDPVSPVEDILVESTLPFLQPSAQGLIKFMRLTGARSSEAIHLRLADIDRSEVVWIYRLRKHKTAHKAKARTIPIGPRAQAVLLERVHIRCPICGIEGRPNRIGSKDAILCGPCADRSAEEGLVGPWKRIEVHNLEAYLFSPRLDREEKFQDIRTKRKTKVQPSQQCRKKAKPLRVPADCYTAQSLARAVRKAAKKAMVTMWHPNQLRHTHGTIVRKMFGAESAQIALGHSKMSTTEIYAERDLTRAEQIARELG